MTPFVYCTGPDGEMYFGVCPPSKEALIEWLVEEGIPYKEFLYSSRGSDASPYIWFHRTQERPISLARKKYGKAQYLERLKG